MFLWVLLSKETFKLESTLHPVQWVNMAGNNDTTLLKDMFISRRLAVVGNDDDSSDSDWDTDSSDDEGDAGQ